MLLSCIYNGRSVLQRLNELLALNTCELATLRGGSGPDFTVHVKPMPATVTQHHWQGRVVGEST